MKKTATECETNDVEDVSVVLSHRYRIDRVMKRGMERIMRAEELGDLKVKTFDLEARRSILERRIARLRENIHRSKKTVAQIEKREKVVWLAIGELWNPGSSMKVNVPRSSIDEALNLISLYPPGLSLERGKKVKENTSNKKAKSSSVVSSDTKIRTNSKAMCDRVLDFLNDIEDEFHLGKKSTRASSSPPARRGDLPDAKLDPLPSKTLETVRNPLASKDRSVNAQTGVSKEKKTTATPTRAETRRSNGRFAFGDAFRAHAGVDPRRIKFMQGLTWSTMSIRRATEMKTEISSTKRSLAHSLSRTSSSRGMIRAPSFRSPKSESKRTWRL